MQMQSFGFPLGVWPLFLMNMVTRMTTKVMMMSMATIKTGMQMRSYLMVPPCKLGKCPSQMRTALHCIKRGVRYITAFDQHDDEGEDDDDVNGHDGDHGHGWQSGGVNNCKK